MKKTTLLILIIVVIITIILANYEDILKIIYKTEYSEYVEKYSKEENIDPLMIYSIIKEESNFNKGAVSNKGACGLMQLMDTTAKEVAKNVTMEYQSGTTLYNPEKNIKLGIKYYAELVKEFKTEGLALAAYNAGSGKVREWIKSNIIKEDGSNLENIPFKETNMYVRKILNDYKIYKKLYNK